MSTIVNNKQNVQSSSHWVGPYGILVPNNIFTVYAEDGSNIIGRDGDITEMVSINNVSEEEYKEKYATFDSSTNNWYHTASNNVY